MNSTRCWKMSPQGWINSNAYCTNKICRNSPLTTELVLSVINLCWLLSPLSTYIVPQWLALCQHVIFTWMDKDAGDWICVFESVDACVSCARVSCICLHYNIAFCLLTQGPPGLAGAHGEKVCFLFSILNVFSLTVCRTNDPATNSHHIKQPWCQLRNLN